MKATAQQIKNRIHLLNVRNPVMNHNIINKLKRRLRKMENL